MRFFENDNFGPKTSFLALMSIFSLLMGARGAMKDLNESRGIKALHDEKLFRYIIPPPL